MAGLRDGIDIAALLQVLDIFLRTQYRRDVKLIMRQTVPTQYIRPLCSDGIQLARSRRNEVRHRVRQAIDDIVLIRLELHQLFAHRCGIVSVLRRTRQTNTTRYLVLLALQVVEFQFVTKRPSRVPDEAVFGDGLFCNRPLLVFLSRTLYQRIDTEIPQEAYGYTDYNTLVAFLPEFSQILHSKPSLVSLIWNPSAVSSLRILSEVAQSLFCFACRRMPSNRSMAP